MQKSDIYVAQMMTDLFGRKTGEISRVDYKPQKPAFRRTSETETRLERSSPESMGIRSSWVSSLIKKLASDRTTGIHRIMILRGNTVIAETSFSPYQMDDWHVTHSLCKSVTAMAIGLLIGEGRLSLDDRICNIIKDERSLLSYVFLNETITVRHLLMMSSGVRFNEAGAITGNDWTKLYMEAGNSFSPGASFEYNSMNSYILSAIVTKITGETLTEYLKPRLFEPLGIDRVFWELSPENISKGGWGLFIRLEDMAKLGRLYMQGGVWEGRQILPADFVEQSVKVQINTKMDHCKYYGYHVWVNDDRGVYAFSFNGMLGQNVMCYPDLDMTICTNAGNTEIFQQGSLSTIIRSAMKDLMAVELPLPENETELSELKALCKSLSGRAPGINVICAGGWPVSRSMMRTGNLQPVKSSRSLNRRAPREDRRYAMRSSENLIQLCISKLDGAVYDLDIKGVGLFPLLMQVIHNNFTDGIKRIAFRRSGASGLSMILYEGDSEYELECGFMGKPWRSTVDMHGEFYDIAVCSDPAADEYGNIVLKNEITFTEEAAARKINICFDPFGNSGAPETIRIKMGETPGEDLILPSLELITTDKAIGLDGYFLSKFTKFGGMDVVSLLTHSTLNPVLKGTLTDQSHIAGIAVPSESNNEKEVPHEQNS